MVRFSDYPVAVLLDCRHGRHVWHVFLDTADTVFWHGMPNTTRQAGLDTGCPARSNVWHDWNDVDTRHCCPQDRSKTPFGHPDSPHELPDPPGPPKGHPMTPQGPPRTLHFFKKARWRICAQRIWIYIYIYIYIKLALRARTDLWNHITELHDGIISGNTSMEWYHGITLRNYTMELCYGIRI